MTKNKPEEKKYTPLGKKIREARTDKGLNQNDFGELIKTTDHPNGFSYQTISKYETGRDCPDIETLKKIAGICDKPVSWFFDEDTTAPEIKTVADVIDTLERLSNAFQSNPDAHIVTYGYEGTCNQYYELTFRIPFSYRKIFDQLNKLNDWYKEDMPIEARDAWLESIMRKAAQMNVDDMFKED